MGSETRPGSGWAVVAALAAILVITSVDVGLRISTTGAVPPLSAGVLTVLAGCLGFALGRARLAGSRRAGSAPGEPRS